MHLPNEFGTVDVEKFKADFKLFEDLWKCDAEMHVNKKRMVELLQENHRDLIDDNLMAEFRDLSYDVSARFLCGMENGYNSILRFHIQDLVERGNALHDELKIKEIMLPVTGIEYLDKTKKISAFFTNALEAFAESINVYRSRNILSSAFEGATLRHNLRSLITVVNEMNGHRFQIPEGRAIAIQLESSTNEWIIHRNTVADEIQVITTVFITIFHEFET